MGVLYNLHKLVCKKVIDKVVEATKEAGKDITDKEATENQLRKYCRNTKNHKEGRFVCLHGPFLVCKLSDHLPF